MELLYHVKPDRRWLYIQRRLKQDEIDLEKIALDLSIQLHLDFFVNHWYKLSFEVLITALIERYEINTIRKFLIFTVPQAIIIKHANLFADKEIIECIKGVNLGDSYADLQNLYKSLGATAPRAFAWFINEGNIKQDAGLRFIMNKTGGGGDFDTLLTFLSEIEDPDVFKTVLNKYTNRFSRKQLAEIEKLFYKKFPFIIQHNRYKIKYNKNIKGVLWLQNKWHGPKNIVQKQLKNLSSLTSKLKMLLRNGMKIKK